MKVSAAVQELERQLETLRRRAEDAEGIIRVYEARDRAQEVARSAVSNDEWTIHWKNGDEDPVEFSYSPGMWLLGLSESFLKRPMPFEIRILRKPEDPPNPHTKEAASAVSDQRKEHS